MTAAAASGNPGSGGALSVIFKGTDACNGGCTFCSVGLAGDHRVGWDDFERLVSELERAIEARALGQVDFTFHGGEPTLLGPDFLDRACARLRALPARIGLHMQTNLLAIGDDLVALARRHDIRIGTSVDPIGTGRRTRSGEDAFPRWLEGYARLVGEGFGVGAIFVITRAALGRAREVYRAAEALAVFGSPPGLQINPVYPQGRAASSAPLTAEELGRFLVDIWRVWEASGRSVQLAPVSGFARWIEEGPQAPVQLSCAFLGDCASSHVGVDYDLRVAGCGRRLDSAAYAGDLRSAALAGLLEASAERDAVARRAAALARGPCQACRFFPICHGGCPDDAALGGDLAGPTPWCRGYRALFEAMEAAPPRRGPLARPAPRERAALLFASADASADEPVPAQGEALERWLLPTEDGRALRYDGGLERLLASRAARLVVWVHARHVRSLAMWRDVLRDPRVSVALFEGGDALPAALNGLNALGARVLLEVAALVAEPGGPERLEEAWRRFLSDPLWRVPVLPFAPLLRSGVERVQEPLVDHRGLPRGRTRVAVPEGEREALRRVAPELLDRAPGPGEEARWMAGHRACLACDEFSACGGALSLDSAGGGSAAPLCGLARQVGARAAELRELLDGAPAS